ncbi:MULTISPECIES: FecR domain-containing protein [unclassified Hyphomonas]|uniref:FecR family protein n=1 Tax=unclassified Hyphomonas TaxID=2630699 RepID=UPI000B2F8598|nr:MULTISPECIES: FecR domain-containing protein [unclassified Hyphomonas]
MTDQTDEVRRRETAALWYTELQDPDVSPDTWEAFLEWEMDPANARAYHEIESAIGIIDRTSLNNSETKNPGRDRKPVLLALAAAAAAFIIGAATLTLQSPKPGPAPLTYATAIGEQETVTLEDGSVLTLNTNTTLTVSYSKAERLIHLTEGEALFEVEHSDRPFLVEAGGTITRALGTAFNVRADQDTISVILIQGSVRVSPSRTEDSKGKAGAMPAKTLQEGIVLKPGDRLDMKPGADPILSTIDPTMAGKWREGLLQFDNVTLAEAIAEMNRYSTTQLRIDDASLASERISGTFPAGKQEEFVQSLELYLPIQYRRSGQEIHISRTGGETGGP